MTNLTTKLYVMVILCRYGEWRQNGQWFPPYTQLGMVFALLEGMCVSFYELRGQLYIKRRIGGHFLLIVWYYQCYRHTWPFPAEVFWFYCSQRLKLSSWRLLQKYIVSTKLDIYVSITITESISLVVDYYSPRRYHPPSSQCLLDISLSRYLWWWIIIVHEGIIRPVVSVY